MAMRTLWGVVFAMVGCGDDGLTRYPDARPRDAPEAPCQSVAPGVYVEGAGDNNVAAEPTSRTLAAGAPIQLCGQLERRNAGEPRDVDRFAFTLATPSRVRFDVSAPKGDIVDELFASIEGTRANATDNGLRGTGMWSGGKIIGVAPNCYDGTPECGQMLPAGNYTFTMVDFFETEPLTFPIEYQATLSLFDADAACSMPTLVSYTEARDMNPANNQNDVMASQGPTANPDDAPEPSGPSLMIGTTGGHRISGVAGMHAAVGSLYDVDTYEIVTSPATNALDFRIVWSGSTHDIDLDVYETTAELRNLRARGWSQQNPEYFAMAASPSTTYVLTVTTAGDAAVLPYDIAVCGSSSP